MQILNVVLTERQHAWPCCFTSNCVWCRAAWPRQNFTIVNKQQLPSLVTWHSAHVTSHRHSCPIRRPQARMVVQDKDKHNKASPLVQIPETSYVVSKVLWIKCACKFVKEIESLPDATIIYPGTLLAHSPSCAHTHTEQSDPSQGRNSNFHVPPQSLIVHSSPSVWCHQQQSWECLVLLIPTKFLHIATLGKTVMLFFLHIATHFWLKRACQHLWRNVNTSPNSIYRILVLTVL